MKLEETIQAIQQQGFVPLFYHEEFSVCERVVDTLYHSGVRIIEFTNRGQNAKYVFEKLIQKRNEKWPELLLLIGTVKNVADATDFIQMGTDAIISPGLEEAMVEIAGNAGQLYIPGCFSPSEIMRAEALGIRVIKLFPANTLGAGFLRSVKEIFPKISFMPTGGINATEADLKEWFSAGAIAVGLGSNFISKQILMEGRFEELKAKTKNIFSLVDQTKAATKI